MYFAYDLKLDVEVEDIVYTPDDEEQDVDVRDVISEGVDDLEKSIKKNIKEYFDGYDISFDLNDYEDEEAYITIWSDKELTEEDLNKILYGTKNYFSTYATRTFFYGEVHDYSYYEEPYQDSMDIDLDVTFSGLEILKEYKDE